MNRFPSIAQVVFDFSVPGTVAEPTGTNDRAGLDVDRDSSPEPVRNRSPKSLTITAVPTEVLSEQRKNGNRSLTSGPIGEGECFASLSPSPGIGAVGGNHEDAEQTANQIAGTAEPIGEHDAESTDAAWREAVVLRPYQLEAIDAIEREFAHGVKRTLLVLPTGCGKTVVFAELARREIAIGNRVLILAHRTELLEQADRKLADVGVLASIEQSDRRASSTAKAVIASIQTLQRKRLERFKPDAFALIITDEAHHAAAKSYRNILDRFPTARVLGVTATPDRGDGAALGKIFTSVAFTYDIRTAIREGHLAPLRARRVYVKDLDLTRVRSHHGDFDQSDLAKTFLEEKALHGVAAPLVDSARKRRTLVFGVDVAHAHALAEVLNRYKPASAIAVDGSASATERAAALSLFANGKFQFLVNCALFTEGFDEPSIECIAMARPTQSRALYAQMIGRGTRKHPGKADCLVLDFVGNSKHRLMGPADALGGGDLPEDVATMVDEMLREPTDVAVDDVIALAEERVAEKRAKVALVAVATYREKEIDPFLGAQMPPLDPNSPAAREPATEKQLAAIESAGLSKPPAGFTKGEASRVLDAIARRHREGLATIPQARLLERLGLNTNGMTKSRATALIVGAKRRGPGGFKPFHFLHEPEFRRGKLTFVAHEAPTIDDAFPLRRKP